jgi:peptide/nickel transport system ATP-binding protein
VSVLPILSVQNLSIALPQGGEREFAVSHISFDIERGQTVCLLGESGSGKSIIANAIMGLLPAGMKAAEGQIVLQGQDLLHASALRLRALRGPVMSMVFQEPMTALNPVMRCGAQIDEMLAQHLHMARAQRRQMILDIMARVRLPDPERIYAAYPHQLSGGQRQRIGVAMALILKPALLICDEPTTAVDVTTQAEILKLIQELQTEHHTAVLFITHDFGVVAEIADEVVVVRQGHMVELGSKQQVLTVPARPYTRMLLNAVPVLGGGKRPPVTARSAVPHPLLEAQNMGKIYASGFLPRHRRVVHAVRNVSLQVRPGETVGIVGESGSGKSTLARCMARLIDLSHGDVLAQGRSVVQHQGRALSPFRRMVQVIFQDPYRSLNPRRTVGASIIEGPCNFGVSQTQAWAHAEALMELVQLSPAALHRYPHEFSGGQRQRISIARALACQPRVLIADEAVSALDVSVQAQILQLLNQVQQQLDLGMVFITHDLRVASQICDHVLVMHQGEVVESGAVEQVFSAPQHAYTRSLLAAAPGRDFAFLRSE